MGIDAAIRHQLAVLARRNDSRRNEFSPAAPTEWNPTEVRNPDGILDTHFTDSSAWELIASRLEADEPVEVVELRRPPRRTGYVMKLHIEADAPLVYVKLQLGSGMIIGRSFHYSRHPARD